MPPIDEMCKNCGSFEGVCMVNKICERCTKMENDEMPDVVWIQNQDGYLVGYKNPQTFRDKTKYHHDRKMQAALEALEKARSYISKSIGNAYRMENDLLYIIDAAIERVKGSK